MKKKWVELFMANVLLIIFTGCNSNTNTISNSNDCATIKNDYDSLWSTCVKLNDSITKYEYYTNDSLLIVEESYKYNVKDGISIEYYTNGNVKSFMQFKNGNQHGKWIDYSMGGTPKNEFYFVDNEQRLLKRYLISADQDLEEGVIQYCIVKDMKAYIIGENFYSVEDGYDQEESTYYDLTIENEVIKLDEKATLKFVFSTGYENIRIIFSDINSNLEIINEDKIDTINVLGDEFNYSIKGEEVGIMNIVGLVLLELSCKTSEEKDTIIEKRFPIYEDIFVIPR